MTRARRALLAGLALLCIALQLDGSLGRSSLALALWLAAMALLDRARLRRLWMPRFWALSVLMAAASGLLLGSADLTVGPVRASRTGLEAGLLMIVRGAFLLSLMDWASRLVVDRDVQRAIRRLGLQGLGDALVAAFGLLPSLSERLRRGASAWRGAARDRGGALATRARLAHEAAVELVRHTALVARSLEHRRGHHTASDGPWPPAALVAAVVGPPGSGKTSVMHTLVERLRAEGVVVGGVTQPAVHEGEARVGYRLRDVATGEEIPFARRGTHGFDFHEAGWRWAAARVAAALDAADCVAVDELGRLEAEGAGHLGSHPLQARRPGQVLLLSVREACAEVLAERVGPFSLRVASRASPAELDVFFEALRAHLATPPSSHPSSEETP